MLIKKKDIAKIIDTLNGLSFILGLFVYLKTTSFTYGLLATISAIILIQIVRFTVIRVKNNKLKQSGIDEGDKMDGFKFESYLESLFKTRGHQAKRTKATNNYGADLIIIKDKIKTVVQAKRYSTNVGIKAAIELADKSNVKLINRDQLVNMCIWQYKST